MVTRDNNRNAMPNVAAFVDELRAQGLDLKVIWCRENGQERGKRPANESVFTIPKGYRMATAKDKR